jgi:hypothetical protein
MWLAFTAHLRDLAVHGRAMHLVNGVALTGRLAKSAEDLGVILIESAPAHELLMENGNVLGARVDTLKGPLDIRARKGVVLAGGFPNDIAPSSAVPARLPVTNTRCHRNPAPATASAWANPPAAFWKPMSPPCAAWAPVSLVKHADGSTGTSAHHRAR